MLPFIYARTAKSVRSIEIFPKIRVLQPLAYPMDSLMETLTMTILELCQFGNLVLHQASGNLTFLRRHRLYNAG